MFYEVKVKYQQKASGKEKSGVWIIKGNSFAEAEKKAMEDIDGLIHISSMKKVNYFAYYEDDNVEKGKFFVADIKEDTIEGKTIINTYLVFSDTVQNALNFISKAEALPIEDTVKAVKETKIIDIIE